MILIRWKFFDLQCQPNLTPTPCKMLFKIYCQGFLTKAPSTELLPKTCWS